MGNGAAVLDLHPDVRGHLASAARRAATTIKQQIEHSVERFLATHQQLESPAEAIFAAWFLTLARTLPHRFEFVPQHEVVAGGELFPDPARHVLALHEADVHRLAFPLLAVEVGHDWHERTPQQVTHRNRRDRDLQAAGWQVFHFSGGEVVTRPDRCVTRCCAWRTGNGRTCSSGWEARSPAHS